jgi:NitT/TauT family transport system permease protein
MTLAGRAAVDLIYGETDNGSCEDLDRTIRAIRNRVCDKGMNGLRLLEINHVRGAKSESQMSQQEGVIYAEVERYYEQTKKLLAANKGFLIAVTSGIVLAVTAYHFRIVEVFLWPYMAVIKAIPVASFIILCLIWLNSSTLPAFIAFLIVLPVIYTNMLAGFKSTDKKMLEMAKIFRLSFRKRLVFIYLPKLKPYIISALSISLGLAWKSGVAAEMIAISDGSMGEMLYNAKLYLATADLFSWTVTIVIVSILFEKVILWAVNKIFNKLEDM